MPIWKPTDTVQEPVTVLTEWRVYSVRAPFSGNKDTIHFIGYTGIEGRVCSPVVSYDSYTRTGTTASGRIYQLKGRSGHNGDAMYVWDKWLIMTGTTAKFEDVTNEYEYT